MSGGISLPTTTAFHTFRGSFPTAAHLASKRIPNSDVIHDFVKTDVVKHPSFGQRMKGLAKGYSEIKTDDEKIGVVADAKASAHGHFTDKIFDCKMTARTVFILPDRPYISYIGEESS